ncbi:MAG: AbgT family transporter, partial [Luteimonas sp.]
MSHPAPKTPSAPAPRNAVTRFLDAVERLGNKLPDPAVLFLILMLVTWAVSALMSGMSFAEIDPRSGEEVVINNLLSGSNLTDFMATMVQTFVNFA